MLTFLYLVVLLIWNTQAMPLKNFPCEKLVYNSSVITNCLSRKLSHIPTELESTKVLMLSFNYINNITETSFPNIGTLNSLLLGKQLGTYFYVGKKAFYNIRNLTFLDLGGNQHLILHSDAFTGLQNLKELYLDYNGLTNSILEGEYLNGLISLQKLVLSGNKITRLRPGSSFESMRLLQFLDLKSNKIKMVCGDDLQHLQGMHLSFDLSSNMLSYENLSQNQSACLNPFNNISIGTLDISSNPWTVVGAEQFFKSIARTKLVSLQMKYSGAIGSSFGFKNIGEVTAETFSWLRESLILSFDISKSFISELNPYVFSGLPDMVSLTLAFNKITKIHKNAFSDLEKLRILNLSFNLLGEIYTESFETLNTSSLQYLDLSSNHIGVIQYGALNGMKSLQTLDLQNNALSCIPPVNLAGLKHVFLSQNRIKSTHGVLEFSMNAELLDLSYNNLQNLGEFDNMMKLPHLQYLNLSYNYISYCGDNAGSMLVNNQLRILDLSHNYLTAVWKANTCLNVFHKLGKLVALDLKNNFLTEFPQNLFNGLVSLQVLDVSKNYVSSLSNELLHGLKSLKALKLSYNSILTLSPSMFESLFSLKYLDVKQNPFICDSKLKDLVKWVKTNNIQLTGPMEEMTCAFQTPSTWISLNILNDNY
ncbi:toll-like receptor 5 [Protopterus annectens]|uniref:toll-like receptor 5 n=1 Tax=Protopterus annectens TaxID=7888 RepID=UPI001CFBD7C3|nr:toll-like receptor 5 [Protopterus annectens]